MYFVAGALLVALVLFAGLPPRPQFLALLNNAGHAPIFGALAWIALRLLEARRARTALAATYATAFAVAVAIGVLVEGVQALIGRDASLGDVAMDAAGAGAVLGVTAAVGAGRRRPAVTAAGLAVAAAGIVVVALPLVDAALAYARRAEVFPSIATFDSPRDLYFVRGSGARIDRVRLPPALAGEHSEWGLQVRLERERSPGLRHEEPAPDWRGHRVLKLDLVNPGEARLRLMLRVHDAKHDQRHEDRFNLAFTLQPHSRRVLEVPLEAIAEAPKDRRLDLGRVAGLVLFELDRPAPVGATFYLTRIWLE